MGRVLALDYGAKRAGIAVTDTLKIIASPLTTVPTSELLDFLKTYLANEEVDLIVAGLPRDLMNRETHGTKGVIDFMDILKKTFPQLKIATVDERYTSKMALDSMIAGGMKKKKRSEKGNVDKISATLILQSWMAQNS